MEYSVNKYGNPHYFNDGFYVEGIQIAFYFDGIGNKPENEASEKGYSFAVNGIRKGRKYFVMNVSGNIFDDNGKIAMFNI